MKKLFFTLIMIVSFGMMHSQTPHWVNYTNGDRIESVYYQTPNLWVAYLGGITRINTNTGEKQFFNIVNSSPIVVAADIIKSDAQNNIWIGGYYGLGKFQEETWTFYDTSNSEIPSNNVEALAADGAGNIWMGIHEYGSSGTVNYLSKFNGTTWTNYTSNNSILPATGVNEIAVEQGNIIWASTSQGLLKISGEDWTLYNTQNSGLPSNYVSNIVVDSENNKWMIAGYNGVLVSFDNVNWEEFENDFDNINQIYVDNSNNKWLCGGKVYSNDIGGIAKFDGQIFTYYTTSNSNILSDFISSMAVDENGIKWVGTEKISLMTANNDDWSVINVGNSKVPSCQIVAIEIDPTGKIWLGSTGFDLPYYDLSLSSYDGLEWDLINLYASTNDGDDINDIVIDNDQNKWLCTYSGLIKYSNENDWSLYTTSNSLINSNWLNSGTSDQNGCIWIGLAPENSQGGGILKIQGDDWEMFTSENSGLPNNNVNAIAADTDGNIWIGVSIWNEPESTGLVKFDGVDWTFYNSINSAIPDSYIKNIKVSNSGEVWMTTGDELVRFANNEWTIFESASEEPFFYALDIDDNDVIWVSSGDYLLSYDNGVWDTASITNGLDESFYIFSIKCDDEGNKWLGTEIAGVLVYNEDGNSSITKPISLETKTLLVSPNPASQFSEIEFNLKSHASAILSVFNITGEIIFSKQYNNLQKGRNSILLDISDYKNGTYLLSISAENTTISGKLIVKRE